MFLHFSAETHLESLVSPPFLTLVQFYRHQSTNHHSVTSHVLTLSTLPFHYPHKPSSNYLTKRFHPAELTNLTRIETADEDLPIAEVQQDLLTLGGRVYMTNITLGGVPFSLVIDTGSSDTWIAKTSFQCHARFTGEVIAQKVCGFGDLYDPSASSTFESISTHDFSVKYTDGEYLDGVLGTEELEIGGLYTRQTMGIVDSGFWIGDGISSGLMGLAYPVLASNSQRLNYTSIIFSLFEDEVIPPVFTLSLSRPSDENPRAGGLLSIGGVPDVPGVDADAFVSVPIQPITSSTYAFYSIPVEGFTILPPKMGRSRTGSPNRPTRKNSANSSTKVFGDTLEMVIDSGTTLMYLPDGIADYIATLFSPPAEYVPMSNVYLVDCKARAPRVGVNIAGFTFWVDEQDLLPGRKENGGMGGGGGEDGMGGVGGWGEGGEGSGSCVVAVQRQGGGDAVLGDSFLKNVVVVFDLGDNEVRVAAREPY
jgi:aspergillopepsin I